MSKIEASIAAIPVAMGSNNELWSSIAANGRGKSEDEMKVVKAIAAISKENDRKERSVVVMGIATSQLHNAAERQREGDDKQIEKGKQHSGQHV